MNIKELKDTLNELPDDYEICLTHVLSVCEDGETWDVCLDIPIVGIASNDKGKELRIVIGEFNYDEPPDFVKEMKRIG